MFKLIGGINTAGKTMYFEDLLCRCDRNILVDVIAATHDIQLTSYGDKYYTVTSDMFVIDLQEIDQWR